MNKQFTLFAIISALVFNHSTGQVQFVKSWQGSTGADTWDVTAVDVDNDSDLDVLIANEGIQEFSSVLLVNDGSGNFSIGQQLFESAKAASFGDLDNDEDQDICLIGTDQFIKILINDGYGSFILSDGQIETHSGIEDIRVGLLNEDSFLDLVVLNLEHPDEIFFNNGDLTFEKSEQELGLSGIDGAGGIELGDLNGDGHTDIFKGNWGIPCAQVWINDGTGYFTELSQNFGNIPEHIHGVALCDFDNDSDLDVFLGYSAENIGSQIWMNDGSGFFTLKQEIFLNSSNLIQDISTADLDDDGDQDVFVSTLWGNNALLLNDGTGEFTESEFQFPENESMASVAGDLNGDNKPDLFVTSNTWYNCLGYNSTWLNTTITEIQELEKTEVIVHPNPTTNQVRLTNLVNRTHNCRLELYDMNGRLIHQCSLEESIIDISKYPKGVYYLILNYGVERNEEIIIKI